MFSHDFLFLPEAAYNKIVEDSLNKDEEVVCRNATVIADSKGNLSFIDNGKGFCTCYTDLEV